MCSRSRRHRRLRGAHAYRRGSQRTRRLVAQYGAPDMLAQSPSLPHAATQTLSSQNGIVGSAQSVFVVHCGATHSWFTQSGVVGSVQSVFVVHCGATHAPVELHT